MQDKKLSCCLFLLCERHHCPEVMFLYASLLLAILADVSSGAPKEDLITDLPGLLFKPGFKQYSGFLEVEKTRKLHYWLVESANNPAKDPVVLWFNGGPGCSSLNGLLAENGPFRVTDDGHHLKKNRYSWNKNANVIYLEAPADVGYSYSTDPDFKTDDNKTAEDNHKALKDFFTKFPEYADRDFYVTGESYGGIYIPTLISLLLDDPSFKNLKGFAVGNGLSDLDKNDISVVYFYQFHNMLSTKSWKELLAACKCDETTPLGGFCDFDKQSKKFPKCQDVINKGDNPGVSDAYNVYADCYDSTYRREKLDRPFTRRKSKSGRMELVPVDYTIGCANDTAMTVYMNLPQTRKALHIPNGLPPWVVCGGPPYEWLYRTMKPQYEKALASKRLRILVYNGDVDSVCNFLGDQWFVDDLNLDNPADRAPWFYKSKNVDINGGFFKSFPSSNLTFVTVRGAGHMVPYDKPEAALAMIDNFIRNKPFGGN